MRNIGIRMWGVAGIVLLMSACTVRKADADYFMGEVNYVDDSQAEVKQVTSHRVDLGGRNYGLIAVYDSLYICWNLKLHDSFYNVFNLDTHEEIGTFCSKGQGPEDLVDASPIFQLFEEDGDVKALVSEVSRSRLLKWNISRSVRSGTTVFDTIVPFTNKADEFRSHLFVFRQGGDTLLCALNDDVKDELGGNEVYLPYYEQRLFHSNELLQRFYLYKHPSVAAPNISNNSFFYTCDAIKPDGTKIVQVMGSLPQINIIDARTGKVTAFRLASQRKKGQDLGWCETYETSVDKPLYYNCVHADDEFIYAVYSGKRQDASDVNEITAIHVFDWGGNLRYLLQTDLPYSRLWADPIRGRLYTQHLVTDEAYYVDLGELNLKSSKIVE